MNKGLSKLLGAGKSSVEELINQTGATRDEIVKDIKGLKTHYRESLDGLFEEWSKDETVFKFFEGFMSASEKGWDAALSYLRAKNRSLQEYLEKQVRLTPHLVGTVDGFIEVYLDTSAKRWIRSPRYRKGVKIGRVAGIVCAFTIFLPVSAGRAIIGVLPGASRAAKYFVKQWKVAKEKRVEVEPEKGE